MILICRQRPDGELFLLTHALGVHTCFPGVLSHKCSLLKHSYSSDDKQLLCRTTCPSSALVSSILATYSTFTFSSIEIFTSTNLKRNKLKLNHQQYIQLKAFVSEIFQHLKFQSYQIQTPHASDNQNISIYNFPHKNQIKNKGHILSV